MVFIQGKTTSVVGDKKGPLTTLQNIRYKTNKMLHKHPSCNANTQLDTEKTHSVQAANDCIARPQTVDICRAAAVLYDHLKSEGALPHNMSLAPII